MRFTLAIFCMFACGTSAMAQYGVSNARDGNGNLIRNTGMNPVRGFSQGPAQTRLARLRGQSQVRITVQSGSARYRSSIGCELTESGQFLTTRSSIFQVRRKR
jgi:hypothetical protein